MKFVAFTGIVLSLVSLADASWGQARAGDDAFGPIASLLAGPRSSETGVEPLTLDEAERIAMEANPEIAVAARRVAMARAHVQAAGAFDDPMAMYRGWGVPLKRPWDYNAAQNMFSLSRTFVNGTKCCAGGRRSGSGESRCSSARCTNQGEKGLLRSAREPGRNQNSRAARCNRSAGHKRCPHQVLVRQRSTAGHPEGSSRADSTCRTHDPLRSRCRSRSHTDQHAPWRAARYSDRGKWTARRFRFPAPS